MKASILSLLVACVSASAPAAPLSESSGTYACTFKVFRPCSGGSASVKLLDGKVQQVSFESLFCKVQGNPGNKCTIESARGGNEPWSEVDKGVRFAFPHPKFKNIVDAVQVTVEGDQIVLDFTDSQSVARCGAQAELPDRVVIEREAKQCKVEM